MIEYRHPYLAADRRTESQARRERAERLLEQAEKHLSRGNTALARAAIKQAVRIVPMEAGHKCT